MYIQDISEDLTHLSCHIAGSIDNFILERQLPEQEQDVKKLENYIKEQAIIMRDDATTIDPRIPLIFWHALLKYPDNSKISKMYELAPKVSLVALELKNYRALSKERLRELRDFCLKLSRESSRYEDPCALYLAA